jgi:hypothetical protein
MSGAQFEADVGHFLKPIDTTKPHLTLIAEPSAPSENPHNFAKVPFWSKKNYLTYINSYLKW